MIALMLALLAQDPVSIPDGQRLGEGETCYTMSMSRNGESRDFGRTLQRVERDTIDGRAVLRVVVHQEVQGGAVTMRDAFVLDAGTMVPLSLDSRRNGKPHVTVAYAPDRITGERHGADGQNTAVDVPLPSQVWEGNLYGLTFAALPLAEGARFALPFWQYDKAFGEFFVRVTGSRSIETPDGMVDAWVLEAGADEARPLTYFVAKSDHRELGYSSGPMAQMVGGDCAGLD